jgi:hypothetical protein
VTDRLKGLTVTLEPNLRDDDAQPIIDAIKLLRGVVSVKTHVADLDHHFAVETVRRDLGAKLWEVIYPPTK